MALRYALFALLAAPALHAQEPCDGFATDPVDGTLYPCENAALLARLPLTDMGVPVNTQTGLPYRGNDIWGWADSDSGREYAVVGNQSGTLFVDVTDPAAPLALGRLPTETVSTTWRSVKVYADHAFVVADGAGDHGMQVFDLTRLRGLAPDPARLFEADTVYYGTADHTLDSAHTIAVNEETGYVYLVGASDCAGGLHMVDVRDPASPTFAGCYADEGYTHETQCVVYHGPDTEHTGREICFAANEDRVAIVDVTDKAAPALLSTVFYANVGYTHQGWLDEGHRFLYVNDELDELNGFVAHTRTIRLDVRDLDAPALSDEYYHDTQATDHNLYIRGDVIYESNDKAGLRLLQIQSWHPDPALWGEIGFLDTHPESDAAGFEGSWSVYPYFGDGLLPSKVIVSDRTRGLFVIAGPVALLVGSEPEAPTGFSLALAPNPFTTQARLTLTVATPQPVRVLLYDALGRRLATPFDGTLAAGAPQTVEIGGSDLPPGTYFVRIEGEDFVATRPLVRTR